MAILDLINQNLREKTTRVKKFLDYDKIEGICYDNIYIEEHKIVLKIPLFTLSENRTNAKLKIEEFNLENYTHLLNYE